jgi:cytochrome d ubiquinol oxidase subunit II
LLLGICLGAISTGDLRASADAGALDSWRIWVAPFPIVTGLLAFTVSAYLAAVYLAWESTGELQEDFRRRALLAWLLAGAASLVLLALARPHAARLWASLTTLPAAAIVVAGVILAPASALALLNRRYGLTRVLAGAQVAVLLIGWGVAQHPYLIAPDLTIAGSAAPKATLALTAMTLPIGAGVLIPSLWYLFAVFKGRNPEA